MKKVILTALGFAFTLSILGADNFSAFAMNKGDGGAPARPDYINIGDGGAPSNAHGNTGIVVAQEI
ncbi:hypothetical protein [Bacillus sp. C1]